MPNSIPDSHSNRLEFFQNLQTKILADATALKWDAAKLLSVNGLLDPLVTAYQAVVTAEEAAIEASRDAAQTYQTNSAALVALLAELRANPGLTDGMRSGMQLMNTKGRVDLDQIQPRVKVKAVPGGVMVSGSKDYAELINLYMRIEGTTTWILVGAKRKRLPFEDQTPLKVPGTPEAREYMGRGVVNDEEVGNPSDIVRVVFGG